MVNEIILQDYDEIIRIANNYGVTINIHKVRSKTRQEEIVFHRALIVYFLRRKGYGVVDIGELIGRDHSTVTFLHSYRGGAKNKFLKRYVTITEHIKQYVPILGDDDGFEAFIISLQRDVKKGMNELARIRKKSLNELIQDIVNKEYELQKQFL